MQAAQLNDLGIQFNQQGKLDVAIDLWKQAEQADMFFPPSHLNLYQVYKSQGNLPQAREQLIRFLNCPVTGFSIESIPRFKQELMELEKQMGIGQPPPQPAK